MQPTTELLPVVTPVIEQFLAQVQPGDGITLTCAIRRELIEGATISYGSTR